MFEDEHSTSTSTRARSTDAQHGAAEVQHHEAQRSEVPQNASTRDQIRAALQGARRGRDLRRDPAHQTRLWGLRFVERASEAQYRVWREDHVTPFARIGYLGSAPSWILLGGAIAVLDPSAGGHATAVIGGWLCVLAVLTAMTFLPQMRQHVLPLAASANCAAGLLVVWLLSSVVLTGEAAAFRAGIMIAGVIIVMFFGFAIFRIPPGMAMWAVSPYTLYSTTELISWYQSGAISAVEAGAFGAAQWIAYLGCLLVCVVIEVVSRRSFCKDQIIAEQQRELRASREVIRRYLPRAVAAHIDEGDADGVHAPRRRRVTVLFSDLVGFTALADRVEAEVLTQVVNEYLGTMSEIIDAHGGTVSLCAGDGIMALFGAPDEMSPAEQSVLAVRAGQQMQARLPVLNAEWALEGVCEAMEMRIGINTGVGSVGSFGSSGQVTYTAIGLHTNIASRLETSCTPGEILVSESTWRLARDQIAFEERGEVACKGVHYPVRTYAAAGSPGGAAGR